MVFRRRRQSTDEPVQEQPEASPHPDTSAEGALERPNGPFDSSEVDQEEIHKGRVDLGGLLVRGVDGMKIQLQVDKRSGRGTSAMLSVGDAAVQLVAVAAPRSSGLWEQTRLQIAADAQKRGGSAQEGSGPFGTEVRVVVPVTTKDGKQGHQPSRISGIDGPRWMLRATFLGKAISDATVFQRLVEVVRQVIIVRGDTPMPPGEVIPLRAPEPGEDAEVPTITDNPPPGEAPPEQA